jgi:phosphoenolpyruvate carboxykinase (GTP)
VIDPMGMARLCVLDQGEYLAQWLAIGRPLRQPPKVFQVNWYRRGGNGQLLWPGYGCNARVLERIVNRAQRQGATARATVAGFVPKAMDFDASGLSLGESEISGLFSVEPED